MKNHPVLQELGRLVREILHYVILPSQMGASTCITTISIVMIVRV